MSSEVQLPSLLLQVDVVQRSLLLCGRTCLLCIGISKKERVSCRWYCLWRTPAVPLNINASLRRHLPTTRTLVTGSSCFAALSFTWVSETNLLHQFSDTVFAGRFVPRLPGQHGHSPSYNCVTHIQCDACRAVRFRQKLPCSDRDGTAVCASASRLSRRFSGPTHW